MPIHVQIFVFLAGVISRSVYARLQLCVQQLRFMPAWLPKVWFFLYFDLCGLEKEIKPAVSLSIAALMLDALMMQI